LLLSLLLLAAAPAFAGIGIISPEAAKKLIEGPDADPRQLGPTSPEHRLARDSKWAGIRSAVDGGGDPVLRSPA